MHTPAGALLDVIDPALAAELGDGVRVIKQDPGCLRMRVDQRDERCVMVNVDPATARRDARILRAIAQRREACAGVYGSVVTPGRVAVGDAVFVDG